MGSTLAIAVLEAAPARTLVIDHLPPHPARLLTSHPTRTVPDHLLDEHQSIVVAASATKPTLLLFLLHQ